MGKKSKIKKKKNQTKMKICHLYPYAHTNIQQTPVF